MTAVMEKSIEALVEICATCRYWWGNRLQDEEGECRRRAPLPRPYALVQMPADELPCDAVPISTLFVDNTHWLWPRTSLDDWCGEYEFGECAYAKRWEAMLKQARDEEKRDA